MNKDIQNIIDRYENQELTAEEANAQLKEAGAGWYLQPLTDEERAAKKEREDAMGFFEPAEKKPAYPQLPDLSRRKDLADMTVRQYTATGTFDVTYNEHGYAVRSVRLD